MNYFTFAYAQIVSLSLAVGSLHLTLPTYLLTYVI